MKLLVTRAVVLLCLVTLVAPALARPPQQQSTRARAWELGGKLSLAAIGLASPALPSTIQKVFASAKEIGAGLGVDVPALPERELDRTQTQSLVMKYLLADAGAPIAGKLGSTYGGDHSALFEVAVKSSLLLLFYTPGGPEGAEVATVIKKRAVDARLPEGLWQPLVAKIEARATFDEVKTAVTDLHNGVRRHLAEEALP